MWKSGNRSIKQPSPEWIKKQNRSLYEDVSVFWIWRHGLVSALKEALLNLVSLPFDSEGYFQVALYSLWQLNLCLLCWALTTRECVNVPMNTVTEKTWWLGLLYFCMENNYNLLDFEVVIIQYCKVCWTRRKRWEQKLEIDASDHPFWVFYLNYHLAGLRIMCVSLITVKWPSFGRVSSQHSCFPILYKIRLIGRISWIKLEPVKHDWKILKVFLCFPLTVGSLV